MAGHVIHISDSNAANDLPSLLERVQAGAEIVIEHNALPVAVLASPSFAPRPIIECIALAPEFSTNRLDSEFEKDLDAAVQVYREPFIPPSWD